MDKSIVKDEYLNRNGPLARARSLGHSYNQGETVSFATLHMQIPLHPKVIRMKIAPGNTRVC
jgi:hypothetical protein